MIERLKRLLTVLRAVPYEPEYAVNVEIPPEMQDQEKVRARFGPIDRLTLIFTHYFHGPILGTGLRLFRPDKHHNEAEKLAFFFMSGLLVVIFAGITAVNPSYAFGLLLILACPQWMYAFTKLQHTVFEYRGYLFAVGAAACGAAAVSAFPWLGPVALALICWWGWRTRERLRVYSDPLLFWKQAREDIPSDPLLASAYTYQLQKRERFGEVDDLYRWMTAARIPECRAFLLNLAAAKFGGKNDNAAPDLAKMSDALKILEETSRRWPEHEDVWRNLGTVQYYLCTQGVDEYRMTRPVEYFKRALTIRPDDSLSWLGMGHCYMYAGKWEEAVTALQHAYEYLPAGACLVEHISLVRVKLMEALERAGGAATNPVWAEYYRREFELHQKALAEHMAWYVTEENAKYLV